MVLVQLGALALAGVYSFIWRYVGLGEVKAFIYAAVWSALVLAVLRLSLPVRYGDWRVPLSVTLMGTVLAFGGVLGLRVAAPLCLRALAEEDPRGPGRRSAEKQPTLLIGAGRAGVLAAREIEGRGDMNLEVKGFVDDDPEKRGAVIHGFRVLGSTEDLPRLVKELGITQVVITIAQISRQEILRLIGLCRKIQVGVRIIPGLYDVLQGKVQVTRIRNVQIEDLLGREPIYLDEAQLGQFLAGKRVMVTGAGGSIGSELARQVARFQPARLLLVERAEFALFEIDGELRRTRPEIEVAPARRRRLRRSPDARALRRAPAAGHLPRGRAQARADDGGQPRRGDQEQRPRHAAARRDRRRARRRGLRHDLHRQGRPPDLDHGGDQAGGRARGPGPRRPLRRRASSPSGSATSSARPAPSCRSSASRSAAAAR